MSKWTKTTLVAVILVLIVVAHYVPVYERSGYLADPHMSDLCFGYGSKLQRFYRVLGTGGSLPAFNADKKLLQNNNGGCDKPIELRLYLW